MNHTRIEADLRRLEMMKKWEKVGRGVLRGTLVITLLLCVLATWFYLEVWVPNRIVSNVFQWHPDYGFQGEVPRKKIRDASYKTLRIWFVGNPNAFIALEEVGNKDSIPILIRELKKQNRRWRKEIDAGEPISCTNLMPALRKLTGMKLGNDHKAWEIWWQQTGRHLPFDEEKGQLVLPEETK